MDKQILFKTSKEEKAKIKTASKVVALNMSSFVRSCAIKESDKILNSRNARISAEDFL